MLEVIRVYPKFPTVKYPIKHANWIEIYTYFYSIMCKDTPNTIIKSPTFLLNLLEWVNSQIDKIIANHYGDRGEIYVLNYLDWSDCISLALTCKQGISILKSISIFKNILIKYNLSYAWSANRKLLIKHNIIHTNNEHIYDLIKKSKIVIPKIISLLPELEEEIKTVH